MIIEDIYRQLFGRGGTNKGTDIDMAEHGRVGGVDTEQAFKFVDHPGTALKLTESGSYTYIGTAPPGTAESAASWRCLRLDDSAGLTITWADGDVEFDNVATDLTALSYS